MTTTATATTAPAPLLAMPASAPSAARWNQILSPYKTPDLRKSLFQLTTTLALFAGTWYLALRALEVSWWLTFLLAFPLSGLLTRLFIIQHDCGHGAFFRSAGANHAVGFVPARPFCSYTSRSVLKNLTGPVSFAGSTSVPTT